MWYLIIIIIVLAFELALFTKKNPSKTISDLKESFSKTNDYDVFSDKQIGIIYLILIACCWILTIPMIILWWLFVKLMNIVDKKKD